MNHKPKTSETSHADAAGEVNRQRAVTLLLLVLVLPVAGCPAVESLRGELSARDEFEKELSCDEMQTALRINCVHEYEVSGCGRSERYHYLKEGIVKASTSGIVAERCEVEVRDVIYGGDVLIVQPVDGRLPYVVKLAGVACPEDSRREDAMAVTESILARGPLILSPTRGPGHRYQTIAGGPGTLVQAYAEVGGIDVGHSLVAQGRCRPDGSFHPRSKSYAEAVLAAAGRDTAAR